MRTEVGDPQRLAIRDDGHGAVAAGEVGVRADAVQRRQRRGMGERARRMIRHRDHGEHRLEPLEELLREPAEVAAVMRDFEDIRRELRLACQQRREPCFIRVAAQEERSPSMAHA